MSKELEAFERIKTEGDIEGNELHCFMNDDDINIVENGLRRLESIENTTPSEALECLEQWYGFLIADNDTLFSNGNVNYIEHQNRMGKIYDEYNTIKQALLKAQELEKENDELLQAVALFKQKLEDTNDIKIATTMMKQLDKNISLEKEKNKYKKTLEIIKSKNVDISYLKYDCHFELCLYNKYMEDSKKLTQEEFNLLKEVLYSE